MFLSSHRLLIPVILLSLLLPSKALGWIWVSPDEIRARPMSGPAWTSLKSYADRTVVAPDLSNQDQNTNVFVLAKAIAYVRTGEPRYRAEVVQNCLAAIGTEQGGRALALGRELAAYVIAAELVGLDPADDERFRTWLRRTLTEPMTSGPGSLVECHEDRPNNWGTIAGGSRAAVAVYLGDRAELERTALVFRGWLGDRSAYAKFTWGDLAWQCDRTKPVGVNPSGCARDGHNLDGGLPDDLRRGGTSWPPSGSGVGYTWEALSGAVMQAEILHRAGFDAYEWEGRAILRAVQFMDRLGHTVASEDEKWVAWVVNQRYGTAFAAPTPATYGKNMGWADYTHAGASIPPPPPPPQPDSSEDSVAVPPQDTTTPPPAAADTTLSPITPETSKAVVLAIIGAIIAALGGLAVWVARRTS